MPKSKHRPAHGPKTREAIKYLRHRLKEWPETDIYPKMVAVLYSKAPASRAIRHLLETGEIQESDYPHGFPVYVKAGPAATSSG